MKKELVKSLFIVFLACITTSSGFAQSTFTQNKHEASNDHEHEGQFFVGGLCRFGLTIKTRL